MFQNTKYKSLKNLYNNVADSCKIIMKTGDQIILYVFSLHYMLPNKIICCPDNPTATTGM